MKYIAMAACLCLLVACEPATHTLPPPTEAPKSTGGLSISGNARVGVSKTF